MTVGKVMNSEHTTIFKTLITTFNTYTIHMRTD